MQTGDSDRSVSTGLGFAVDATGPLRGIAHTSFAHLARLYQQADAATAYQCFDAELGRHGALLVRGATLAVPQDLETLLGCLMPPREFLAYEEDRVSPRTRLAQYTYTSTEYKPSHRIFYHNECCTRLSWPMRIAFYCRTPAVGGGRTPIASVRAITAQLPKDLLAEFAGRGVRYVRNLNDKYGMPLAYAFGTTDRATIEAYCADQAMSIEWLGKSEARLTLHRPALARHPQTGEELWFNNVGFWSRQNWDRASQALLRNVPSSAVAFHTTFGDGGEIPDSTVRAVGAAYEAASAGFDWQAGDLLVLDNMLCAHGREGFEGPRAIWTLMARAHARPV